VAGRAANAQAASSALTRELLAWRPVQPGLISSAAFGPSVWVLMMMFWPL
jgi:hypothetical protein